MYDVIYSPFSEMRVLAVLDERESTGRTVPDESSSRFYPYVYVHVSRSATQPIATVTHIAWSVYLCIFRYVYVLFLLMTHVLFSVCLFVCVLGWFVCLSFPFKYQLISISCFFTYIWSVMWFIATVSHIQWSVDVKFWNTQINARERLLTCISICSLQQLSLIHIWRCRRSTLCRSRWSPYH